MNSKGLLATAATLFMLAGCATQPGGPESQPAEPPTADEGQQQAQQEENQPKADDGERQEKEEKEQSGEADESSPTPGEKPPQSPAEVSSSAVMSLLDNADNLIKADKLDAAASTLERALNLDPRNPFIYQRLAALRLAQDQHEQAEQMARKSNSVAGDNPFVKTDNWKLIAEARKKGDDARGARKASNRAVSYQHDADQLSP